MDEVVLQPGEALGHGHSPDKTVVVKGVEPWSQTHTEVREGLHVQGFHVPLQVDEEVSENGRAEGLLELPQPHQDERQLVVRELFNF